jgi:hypothetical protein
MELKSFLQMETSVNALMIILCNIVGIELTIFCRRTHFSCWLSSLQNGLFKADSSEDIRWSFIDLFVVHVLGSLFEIEIDFIYTLGFGCL